MKSRRLVEPQIPSIARLGAKGRVRLGLHSKVVQGLPMLLVRDV